MDTKKLAKNCGCVSKKCNNRPVNFFWCTNYSCSYNRNLRFLGKPKQYNADESRPKEKSLIEEQREAQASVMEGLRKRRKREQEENSNTEGSNEGGVGGVHKSTTNFLQGPCSSWQDGSDQHTDSLNFPNFELFPTTDRSINKLPMTSLGNANPRSPQEDSMTRRQVPSDVESKGVNASNNPYDYLGKKKPVISPNGDVRQEPFGYPSSLLLTTSIFGHRPERRHFNNRPTFLWI